MPNNDRLIHSDPVRMIGTALDTIGPATCRRFVQMNPLAIRAFSGAVNRLGDQASSRHIRVGAFAAAGQFWPASPFISAGRAIRLAAGTHSKCENRVSKMLGCLRGGEIGDVDADEIARYAARIRTYCTARIDLHDLWRAASSTDQQYLSYLFAEAYPAAALQ